MSPLTCQIQILRPMQWGTKMHDGTHDRAGEQLGSVVNVTPQSHRCWKKACWRYQIWGRWPWYAHLIP